MLLGGHRVLSLSRTRARIDGFFSVDVDDDDKDRIR